MIAKPFIAKWRVHAPWKEFAQVEQDLVIEGLLKTEINYNQDEAFKWLKAELIAKM